MGGFGIADLIGAMRGAQEAHKNKLYGLATNILARPEIKEHAFEQWARLEGLLPPEKQKKGQEGGGGGGGGPLHPLQAMLGGIGRTFQKGFSPTPPGWHNAQQAMEQAFQSTGRPPMQAQVPAGPGALANVLPAQTEQVGGVAPSMMLSPSEQLAIKLDETRATEKQKRELNEQAQAGLRRIQTDADIDAARRKEVERSGQALNSWNQYQELKKVYPDEAAREISGWKNHVQVKGAPKLIRWDDPDLIAWANETGNPIPPEGSQWWGFRDAEGKLINAARGPDVKDTTDQLTGTVKTAIQSIRLANPGLSDAEVKLRAGRQVQAQIGAGIQTKELNLAVDRVMAEMAGIAPPGTRGAGTAPPGTPNAPPPPGTPATSNRVGGIETSPVRPGSDDDLKNQYISQILNPISGGRNKFTQVAYMKGRNLLMRDTGLSPFALDAAIQTHKGTAKSLQTAIQNEGGFERLGNAMGIFGKMLEDARNKVNDTGVSALNRWIQAGMRAVPGDPDVGRLDIAFNAFIRTYTQVLSGGWQSRAMPPVANAEEARKTFGPEIQKGRMSAMIDQAQQETKGERQAIEEQKKGLYDDLKKPFGQEFSEETATPSPARATATATTTAPLVKPPRPGAKLDAATAAKYLAAEPVDPQTGKRDRKKAFAHAIADQWAP